MGLATHGRARMGVRAGYSSMAGVTHCYNIQPG